MPAILLSLGTPSTCTLLISSDTCASSFSAAAFCTFLCSASSASRSSLRFRSSASRRSRSSFSLCSRASSSSRRRSAAGRLEGACEPEVGDAPVRHGLLVCHPPWLRPLGLGVLRVDPPPDRGVERRVAPLTAQLVVLLDLAKRARPHHAALRQVQQVVGPALQLVEDVRAVEDGAATLLGLGFQEPQDALTCEDVEVGRDLVHEVDGPRGGQDLQQLAAAALPVRDAVDLPV
mmetsp:Transcript_28159/g.75123  ORF Transcript_28159/g.75123 Transcript_28159/m.75123 type:complete len:233 (+) Transcript_28159:516-1214(+)